MILIAFAGLALHAAAAATPAAASAAYAEAAARAEAFNKDPALNAYDDDALYPIVTRTLIQKGFACRKEGDPRTIRFVITFKDGAYAGSIHEQDTETARCLTPALDAMTLPAPPVADYAEKITFMIP
jgi:hypothetical protein